MTRQIHDVLEGKHTGHHSFNVSQLSSQQQQAVDNKTRYKKRIFLWFFSQHLSALTVSVLVRHPSEHSVWHP
jgi:hypothetical protein